MGEYGWSIEINNSMGRINLALFIREKITTYSNYLSPSK
jgi:hypothetical protein